MTVRLGIVTGRTIAENQSLGGPPVRLLQVMLTDESDVQTVQLVGQTGEESNPPNGSLVVVLAAGESFKLAVASDEGVVPDLAIGGKRLFAVDDEGAVIAQVRLDPDGLVTVSNNAASFTMSPGGEFSFHGTSAAFDCPVSSSVSITAPTVEGTTDVTFAGKSALTHIHSGGTISGSTGVPT
jgi:phage gp45-like